MNAVRVQKLRHTPPWLGFAAGFLLALGGMLPALPVQASTTAVGTIQGSFSVTPTGAATYTIPIAVPRGSGGLTPSIALVYNSQSGSGAAGWGWTLSGLSAITRCALTIDDDGSTRAVQLTTGDSGDDFCLDGQRLRNANGGVYGASGTTYDTELRSYALITSNGTAGNGPSYFTVQTKDGKTYEYGNTADSKILATGTSTVRVWALDKVTDANSNYYTITYQNNDTTTGDYWPLTLSYTGNTQAGTSPLHTLTFSWAPRADVAVRTSFMAGTLISQTQLLTGLTVSYNGTATFTYSLYYNGSTSTTPPLVPGDNRYQLTSIQECAADGSCFNPTSISWQEGAAGWTGDQAVSGSNINSAAEADSAHLMDVNGDGIEDLVYVGSNSDWWVMFGESSGGLSAPVDTGIAANPTYYPYALAINYDGSGRTSLLVPASSSTWQVLVPTGNETGSIFTESTVTGLSTPGTNSTNGQPIYAGSAWVVDFYGRGLGNFVYTNGTEVYLLQNNGPGSDPPFGAAQPLYSVATSGSGNALFNRSTTQTFVDTPLDFDGSGRGGALAAYETTKTCEIDGCQPPPPVFGYSALLSTQTPLAPTPSANPSYQGMGGVSGVQLTPDPMSANGSGLTDLLYACCTVANQENTYYFQIELDTGTSFTPVSTTVVDNFLTDSVIADYYGDGRQEAIVSPTSGTWDMIRVNYDPPSQTFVPVVTSIAAPYPSDYVEGSLRIGNVDANGLDDLVYAVENSSGDYAWHENLHAGGAADLVTSITDGMGNTVGSTAHPIVYASIASGGSVYAKGTGTVYPIQDVQFPLQVVSSYRASNGIGGLYTVTFTYAGAEFETHGQGFLGFATRTVTDNRNNVTTTDTYDQTWPWIGEVTNQTVTQGAVTLRSTTNTPASLPASCTQGALCFPYVGSSTTAYSDPGGNPFKTVETQNNAFDSYGNLINQTVTTTDNTSNNDTLNGETTGKSFTTTIASQYNDGTSSSNYCADVPTSVTITKTNTDGTMIRETSSPPPDANCERASVTVSQGTDSAGGVSGTATPLTTTYNSYDDWGNPKSVTVSASNITSRTSTSDYTTYNGEYPDKLTNALSQSVTETWNPALGVRTALTDVNGHTTSWGYDSFGRKLSETHADGTVLNWSAPTSFSGAPCPSGVTCYAISASETAAGATIPFGSTVYDADGRVLEQQKVLLGGVLSTVQTAYNLLGEVTSVTQPYLAGQTVFSSTYTNYDVLGRVGQVTSPAPATASGEATTDTTTYGYVGFTTTATTIQSPAPPTGIASETTSTTTDALGEVINKVDGSGSNSGSTLYNYDPFGDLVKTTDADGQPTSMTYDGLGHKTGMTDPNMGAWSYTPDALGEVISQADAKGQVIKQGYDVLGRLRSREECTAACTSSTETVADAWTYDTATNGIGLLASESDSNGFSKVYTYDSLSRPSEVDTTVPGTTAPYAVNTSYDSFGRAATVTYPASVTPLVPVANAVATPTSAAVGNNITLNGSGSTGPSGNPLTYQWTQTAGPVSASLATSTGETTTVTSATPGGYTFQLVVTDSAASSLPASVSVSFVPPTPGTPSVNQSPEYSGSYTVSWGAVSGTTSYEVYQSTNGTTFSELGSVSSNSDSLSGQTTGTYYYKVAACENSVCSSQSASSSGVQVILIPASAPTGLTLSPNPSSSGNFTLAWTAVSGATYYNVYRSGDSTPVAQPSSSPANLSQVMNTTDSYYVEACDQAGCSPASTSVSEQTLSLPGVPPSVSANPTSVGAGNSFTLSWGTSSGTVSYYNINGGATHYSPSTHSATLNAPVRDGTYGYYVQACNAAGCSGDSATVDITVTGTICGKSCSDSVPAPPPATSLQAVVATPPVTIAPGTVVLASSSDAVHDNPGLINPVTAVTRNRRRVTPNTTVLAALVKERAALTGRIPAQPSEAAMQAEAVRRERAQLPSLLPAAPATDVAAWNAWDAAYKQSHPNGPDYAPPEYIALANAKLMPASGSTYRFEVQYNYDTASGALESVANAATGFVYWQADTSEAAPVDAYGHLQAYTDGNNVSTVMAYDPATGAPLGISSGIGQSTAVQSLVYTWDGYGNLEERDDANRSLSESFKYDDLNRLTQSTVTNPAANGPTLGFSYDAAGNIQTKTVSGVLNTYAYEPDQPYAVESVTNSSGTVYTASYDVDGNMTERNGYPITWTVDNLPSSIASAAGSSTFSYDPDGSRYAQSATFNGATTATAYIGGLFEVVSTSTDTQYRHNIVADGEIVAVHTIDASGAASTSYLHSDHLGSVDTITDDQGNVIQSMSFDAFGLRRDPSNWEYDLSQNQISTLKSLTDRGYTFQEQLDNVGLVHMNGRVYDPGIGRFISADPTVPDPLYSQAFNRYSYVYNSPLSMTDPGGFDPDMSQYTYFMCVGSGSCVFAPAPPATIQLGSIFVGGNGPSLAPTNIVSPSAAISSPQPISINTGVVPNGHLTAPQSPTAPPCDCQVSNPYGNGNPWNNNGDLNGLLPSSAGCGTACGADWVTGTPDWSSMGGSGPLTTIPSFNPEADPPGIANKDAKIRAATQSMPHSPGAATGPMRPTTPMLGTLGQVGGPNGGIGVGLVVTKNSFVRNGLWRGSNGSWYTIGRYFGNQYGRTAAQARRIAGAADVAGRASLVIGLTVTAAQYYNDVWVNGNTAMGIRDSLDPLMGVVALDFPFGTAAAAIWFGGEILYDSGAFQGMEQAEQAVGPGFPGVP
ncbi:MAG: PKD domain-containing protein [Gammaproteobacteria bacterium]